MYRSTVLRQLLTPACHARGIAGLIEPDERLLLAHTHGDRLRLRAKLAYLNARVEPDATRRGTDRRAALVRFRALVRDGGLPWVAKLDIASFFDAIPHGPLLAALRLPRANVFLTAFDRALVRAGIVFLRYLDDVTILAAVPAALAADLGTAKTLLESLGMSLREEKTQAAWLGGGESPVSHLALPGRGPELPVAGEIAFLGIHFLGPERFRARETTVNRLLRKIRTTIVAGRGKRPARQRYFRACRRINELFGYEFTGRPTRHSGGINLDCFLESVWL